MRAVSTVLDVAVFLLLVSAAVATVVYAPAPVESGVDAGETASVLATTTATVEYDIHTEHRRSHGTLATLLARAAVANTTVNGSPVTVLTDEFRAAVRTATREALVAPNQTHVTATWQPYRGAPVRGRVSVGSPPPAGADVAAATVRIPSPVDATATQTLSRLSGYRGLARHVARPVTTGLLPSTALDASLGQGTPTAVASSRRFRAFEAALGLTVDPELASRNVSAAHARVTAALAADFRVDMRRQFRSPGAARQALRTGIVTITVRRWLP